MKNPAGQLRLLTQTMRRLARYGDVQGLRSYMCSDAFLAAFVALDPPRRRTAMLAYADAEAICESKTRQPLAKPTPVSERKRKGERKNVADWRDPVMLAKLSNAYARTGTDEGAARLCGVTEGAARLARKRYLGAPTTASCAQAA